MGFFCRTSNQYQIHVLFGYYDHITYPGQKNKQMDQSPKFLSGTQPTLPATGSQLDEAAACAATGLVTPKERIRRGMVSDPSFETNAAPKRKIIKKVVKKRLPARPLTTSPAPPTGQPAVPTAAKSAPPMPPTGLAKTEAETTPKPNEPEQVLELVPAKSPEGPTSAKRQHALAVAAGENLQRADTKDQTAEETPKRECPTPSEIPTAPPAPPAPPAPTHTPPAPPAPTLTATAPPAPAPTPPPPPAPKPAAPRPTLTPPTVPTLNGTSDAGESEMPPSSGTASEAPPAPAPAGRKRKAKTVEEKAIHAKFMRFTRHIQSC